MNLVSVPHPRPSTSSHSTGSNPGTNNDQISKKNKSDPLRYTKTVQIITTPIKYWIYICIVSSIGVLMWSILGRIPEKVTSNGIITNPFELGTVIQPSQSTGGTYQKINVTIGEAVIKGETLVEIYYPELIENIIQAKDALNNAELDYNQQYNSLYYSELLRQQEIAISSSSRYYGEASKLVKKGSISQSSASQAQQQYESAIQSKLDLLNQKVNAESNIAALKRSLDQAYETNRRASVIKSPYSGKIASIYIRTGSQTSPGSQLLLIDTSSNNNDVRKGSQKLSVISYYSPTDASKIRNGMDVYILPQNVKANTVGNLLGKVTSVSKLPASVDQAKEILGSSSIAEDLVTSGRSIAVVTQLISDSSYASGFKWINGSGPPTSKPYQYPQMGVNVTANVITKRVPPITLGIPALKKFFGIQS